MEGCGECKNGEGGNRKYTIEKIRLEEMYLSNARGQPAY